MSDLRIVQGNTFATSMEINAVDVSGEPVADFDLQQCTDIQPYYRYRGREIDVEDWTTDDQSVVIVWDGTALGLGDYDVFIRGKFGDTDWRTADSLVFEIVRFGWEANIPEGTTVLDGTYFTEATFSLITEISTSGGAPSSTTPLMDGEASVGTENAYARGDHRHPTDTSRQAVISDLATIRSGASAGASAYQKPAGGIPKSDLSSGVQTSLGLADSALQSYTETDPVFEASPAAGITAEDITSWDNKSDFSGSYNDLTNKPTIPAAQIQSDWDQTDTSAKDFIKNKPTIPASVTVDSALSASSTNPVQNKVINTALGTKANSSDLATVATSGSYSDLTNKPSIPAAQVQSDWDQTDTTAKDFIKNKPTIPSGVVVDSALSASSTNPVQNKVINTALGTKANSSDLATVATSGSYNDLTNKPSIPAAQIQSDWTQNDNTAKDYIKNKPSIPVVNDATLTIQKEGVSVGTFTANASTASTINIVETDPVFAASAAHGITNTDITNWNGKTSNTGTITEVQANGTSVATSGVANIPSATTSRYGVTQLSSSTSSTSTTLAATASAVKAAYDHGGVTSVNGSTGAVTVQATLVSGTNIKTINNTSLLGSGDITISGGGSTITFRQW